MLVFAAKSICDAFIRPMSDSTGIENMSDLIDDIDITYMSFRPLGKEGFMLDLACAAAEIFKRQRHA